MTPKKFCGHRSLPCRGILIEVDDDDDDNVENDDCGGGSSDNDCSVDFGFPPSKPVAVIMSVIGDSAAFSLPVIMTMMMMTMTSKTVVQND